MTQEDFAYDKISRALRAKLFAKASELVLVEIRNHGGNLVHTADGIGVHHATLKRWIVILDEKTKIRKEIEKIRQANG